MRFRSFTGFSEAIKTMPIDNRERAVATITKPVNSRIRLVSESKNTRMHQFMITKQ